MSMASDRVLVSMALLLRIATAGVLSLPANTLLLPPKATNLNSGATTAAPIPPLLEVLGDLRKRDGKHNTCGYWGVGTDANIRSCVDPKAYCAATILSNGSAYQYCSTSGAVDQWAATSAVASCTGSASQSLGSVYCCAEEHSLQIITYLYTAANYTVTGFGCYGSHGTVFADANTELLDPASFSVSLAQETAPMTTSKSNLSPTTGTIPVPKPAMSTKPGSRDSGKSGLSTGAKAGIGAGVGVGGGIAIIAGAAFFFWRRNQKKKQNQPAASAAYIPQMASKEPSYFEVQPKHGNYGQGSPPPQWSPNLQSPQSGSTEYGMSATYSPVEVPGPVPHELQAPTEERK